MPSAIGGWEHRPGPKATVVPDDHTMTISLAQPCAHFFRDRVRTFLKIMSRCYVGLQSPARAVFIGLRRVKAGTKSPQVGGIGMGATGSVSVAKVAMWLAQAAQVQTIERLKRSSRAQPSPA